MPVDTRLAQELRALERALTRLSATGGTGDIARRNARQEFSQALSALRRKTDEVFPAPARRASQFSLRRTPQARAARERRLRETHVRIQDGRVVQAAEDMKRAGVGVIWCSEPGRVAKSLWVPRWAWELAMAGFGIPDIKHAKTHLSDRKRMLVDARLRGGQQP